MKSGDARYARLLEALGPDVVLDSHIAADRYLSDWTGDHHGQALAIFRPASVEDVCKIVSLCADTELPIVPQGGNTGLVSGAVTKSSEYAVVSLERLNRIRRVSRDDFSITVDSGCVLQAVKEAAEDHDCIYPTALGAQGTCQIGGTIATNAGGVNVLRYGMTRDLVLGLEVVLPNGVLWDGLSSLRKDNRGYDLKQLFLGSEGTLGVVTGACLKLFPKPDRVETAYLGLRTFEEAMGLFSRARYACSDLLTGFEVIGSECIGMARYAYPGLPVPVSENTPVHVLFEVSSGALTNLREMLESFLADEMASGTVVEAVLAENKAQALSFWKVREGLVEGHARRGFHVRSDVSVALSDIPRLIDALRGMLTRRFPGWMHQAYGHAGDGNVHFNALPPDGLDDARCREIGQQIEGAIFEIVEGLGGSFSAEHGIGRTKLGRFQASLSDPHRYLIETLKHTLDPAGLMNPGCMLG